MNHEYVWPGRLWPVHYSTASRHFRRSPRRFLSLAMGNVCMQSCCHKHAKLHTIDKLVNVLIGSSLQLHKLTPNDMKALEKSRKAAEKSNDGYEKMMQKIWISEDKTFDRLEGNGEPLHVLFHRPKKSERKDLPLILWVHGGGMILGNRRDVFGLRFMTMALEKFGPFCFASLQYRVAPEFKFPAAVDDFISCYRSLVNEQLAHELGFSIEKMSVAGVSAGAFVAAHGLLRLGRQMPAALWLYPMVDPQMTSESHQLYGSLPACPSSFLRVSWDWLLSDADGGVRGDLIKSADLLQCNSALMGQWVFMEHVQYFHVLDVVDLIFHDASQYLNTWF